MGWGVDLKRGCCCGMAGEMVSAWAEWRVGMTSRGWVSVCTAHVRVAHRWVCVLHTERVYDAHRARVYCARRVEMGYVQMLVAQCDVCGHEWIATSAAPSHCASSKCRSRRWNDSGATVAPAVTITPKPMIAKPPAPTSAPAIAPAVYERQACAYTEDDRETGNRYGCTYPLGHKGAHKRGTKIGEIWD